MRELRGLEGDFFFVKKWWTFCAKFILLGGIIFFFV